EQQQKHGDPAAKRQGVCRRIRVNEPLLRKRHPARSVLSFLLPMQQDRRRILCKDDPAFHALRCPIRLVSLTLGTRHDRGRDGLHSHTVEPRTQSDKKISGLIQAAEWRSFAWWEKLN